MSTDPLLSRRGLLKASAAGFVALGASTWGWRRYSNPNKYSVPGDIVGADWRVGHLLREGADGLPTETHSVSTVIVGGGIAGLSAAWWLKKHGDSDFILFEMNSNVGGNAASGSNSISRYPWGAHYVPFPCDQATYTREFFEDVGIIQGYENGLPVYNEYYICADPDERILFQGAWQDGLIPQQGVPSDDLRQYQEFFDYVHNLKTKIGADGRYLFTIPLELSSRDPEYLKLDEITMAQFMSHHGWTSKNLTWYVNYCCRDDYGYGYEKVSAWAGLHYFAARTGQAANADSSSVLTWPEGNGFLVEQLKNFSGKNIRPSHIVTSIEDERDHCSLTVINTKDKSCSRYLAQNVIYCGPRFTANKVIKNYQSPNLPAQAPWLVANISVKDVPAGRGMPISWDNVSFYSQSLGYIVANLV
jgi:hypothetical protein